jgi:Ca-activated chloride channel family protein
MTGTGGRASAAWAIAVFALAGGAAGGEARPAAEHLRRLVSPRSIAFRSFAANVIVPQSRSFRIPRGAAPATPSAPVAVAITHVAAGVAILDQAATTTLDISLRNATASRQEAELVVPVPDGAVVRGFTFQGAAREPTAQVLPKEQARRIYDSIVAKVRDPALLEFAGYNLVRSSVFPVEAGGTQKVRLTYEHLLAADGDRVDYVLPRSESLDYKVPWRISVSIKSKRSVSTVYSPSHRIETVRTAGNAISARVAVDARTEPGPFRLSFLLQRNGVTASLLAYPDPKVGGGYFLLLAGLPAKTPRHEDGPAIKREVTLVFDRSGSMRGEKIEQVREAALQVLAGLEPGEAFNIITYSESVEPFSTQPVVKTRETVRAARAYLEGVRARGGTNIHDALVEALGQKPVEGTLPIVLFLTDGLPTIGQTSEVAIREVAMKANPYNRRIFTFGVGVDVNVPLLSKIASETRANSTFVLPKEDVEVKVAGVFKRLAGPVLADAVLETVDIHGAPAPGRTRDMIPARLPDLFEGDKIVLLGQYVGDRPLGLKLSGNYLGRRKDFEFTFSLARATTRNSFVPRLWASRKIGVLVDAIRQMGANGVHTAMHVPAARDPRLKELVDEIVRLSTEFGILTEYTAFLAREGTDLSKNIEVLREANRNFVMRAQRTRDGLGALNQEYNNDFNRGQSILNPGNWYYDKTMNRVSVTTVQQFNDRAFFKRGGQWVDSRLIDKDEAAKPKKVVKYGTPEFDEISEKLTREGRQGSMSLGKEILIEVDGEAVKLSY